jgi:hypothetical protein
VPVGQARFVAETCNDAGVHVSSTAEGVEITVPLHALTKVRRILEMDTLQFGLKYLIFLSKNYREECVPARMTLASETDVLISTKLDQEVCNIPCWCAVLC